MMLTVKRKNDSKSMSPSSSAPLSSFLLFRCDDQLPDVRVNGQTSLCTAKYKLLIIIYCVAKHTHTNTQHRNWYRLGVCCCFQYQYQSHTSACIIHAHLHKLKVHYVIVSMFYLFILLWFNEIRRRRRTKRRRFLRWLEVRFFLPISYHQNSTRAHTHACTHKQRVRGEDSCFAFFFFFVQCTASCVIHTWPSVVANSRRNSRFTFAHSLALSFDLIIEKVLTQSVWSCVGTCSWEAFDLYVYTILHTHSTSCVYITCACACLYWFVIFVDSHFPWLPG